MDSKIISNIGKNWVKNTKALFYYLSIHFAILIVLLYSSISVTHFSITTYKLLQSIAVENRSKLKVCITLNFYPIDQNLRNWFQFMFLKKLVNYIENWVAVNLALLSSIKKL
jgi:hypothetical protein